MSSTSSVAVLFSRAGDPPALPAALSLIAATSPILQLQSVLAAVLAPVEHYNSFAQNLP